MQLHSITSSIQVFFVIVGAGAVLVAMIAAGKKSRSWKTYVVCTFLAFFCAWAAFLY
jgi:hypothetical protein